MGKQKIKVLEYPGIKKDCYNICSDGTITNIRTGQIKTVRLNGNGYSYVSLTSEESDNFCISVALHRLLAYNFIAKTEDDIKYNRNFVHFKDFNRNHITVSNLEWVSGIELKVLTDAYYDNPKNKKDYAEYICKLLIRGYEPEDICKLFGFSKILWCPIIGKMMKKQIYKDITKKYKFD